MSHENENTMRVEQTAGRKPGPEQCQDGWDDLVADDKGKKETILAEHFPKAFERFCAGVSLAQIRANYERLGAKYSSATFRKKWNELVAKHAEQL